MMSGAGKHEVSIKDTKSSNKTAYLSFIRLKTAFWASSRIL